eukprot:GHVH01007543.1.p1 GENE.GHVH01007543.1~~GHVH01007543.1.p1  ORF type:complete len:158 (+),score=19.16 GHVH01007543.1:127-600(+)
MTSTFETTLDDGTVQTFEIARGTLDDYEDLLQLVPMVTRCNLKHSQEELELFFSEGSRYYPFVVRVMPSRKLVAYSAIYTMSHLGRVDVSRMEHVVVHPDYRGHHIGTNLVDYVINFTKSNLKCDRIDLTVENPIAKHIYVTHGFKKIETEVLRLDI